MINRQNKQKNHFTSITQEEINKMNDEMIIFYNSPIMYFRIYTQEEIRKMDEEQNKKKYNYKKMKEDMKKSGIAEELMAHIFHPKNMDKWDSWGFPEFKEFKKLID